MNPKNTWATTITVAELKTLWAPEAQGKVTKWNQVRAGWPDREIHLFGAGVDSGTYDYFTEAIIGKAKASRGDFTSSEDDNVLVQGVSSDELALGFLPFAYYEAEHGQAEAACRSTMARRRTASGRDRCRAPRPIRDGTYQPLSRPVFIYVSKKAAERPEVQKFVEFYLGGAETLVREVGYVGWAPQTYDAGRRALREARRPASLFAGADNTVGVTIEQLLARER